MDQSLLAALRDSPIFSTLSESEIALLLEHSLPEHYFGGQALFREGEPGTSLIILTRGWVELCRTTPAGRVIQIGQAGPGEVLGEMALLDAGPRSATATVLAPTIVHTISTARFEALLEELEPAAIKLLQQLNQVLCSRLRNVMSRIEAEVGFELLAEAPAGGNRKHRPLQPRPSAVARRNASTRHSGNQAYSSELVTTAGMSQPFPDPGKAGGGARRAPSVQRAAVGGGSGTPGGSSRPVSETDELVYREEESPRAGRGQPREAPAARGAAGGSAASSTPPVAAPTFDLSRRKGVWKVLWGLKG